MTGNLIDGQPVNTSTVIIVGGSSVGKIPEIIFISEEKDRTIYQPCSGDYNFEIEN